MPADASAERRFQALIEHSWDAIALLTADGTVTYASPATRRILGYDPDELVGRNALELIHPDDRALTSRLLGQLLAQPGASATAEYRFCHKDGSWRWLEGTGTNLLGDPSVQGIVANFRDITERKRIDEASSRLVAIVESSDDAIISETLDGILTSWNPGAERIYGYRAEEAIGQPRSIIIPPDHRNEFPTMLERLKRGERIEHFETVRLRKDGRRIDVSVSMSPIRDPAGRIVGAAGIAREITEHRRAQERQQFLDEAGRVLVSSLDYMTTLGSLTRLLVPRLADYCSIYALGDDEVLRPIQLAHLDPAKEPLLRELERLHPMDASADAAIGQALRGGETSFIPEVPDAILSSYARDAQELQILRALGPCSVIIVPLSARGRVLGLLSFVMAESGRRYGPEDVALAEELARRAALAVDNARLYREARAAIKKRDEFVSVASHELRTPLTTLTAYVQLLLMQFDQARELDPSAAAAALRSIEQQTGRLSSLISQLLDSSRLEAGHLQLERRPTDLSELVENAVAAARARTDRHHLTLEGPSTLRAPVDPLRIDQVLTNLLDNAIKYSRRGGPIEVELSRLSTSTVELTVRDHGIGIPPEERAGIFERFYQAHPEHHLGGMGLGLYISRQIVELHGGELLAEFPEDGGSRFIVRLPLGADPEPGDLLT